MPPMDDLSRPPPPRPAAPSVRECNCAWQFIAGLLTGLLLAAAVIGVMGGACRPDPAPSGDEHGVPAGEPDEPADPPTKSAFKAAEPGAQIGGAK